MLPTIQIGPLAMQSSGLILLISFMLALEVSHRAATRLGLNGDNVYNLLFLSAFAGIIGARLGYVLQYWSVYQSDLAGVLALSLDGLSPPAGLAAALISGVVYAQHKGLDNLRLLDALAPGLLILAAGFALADLASGNGYGSPTSLPWAIPLWNAQRHPVQVYQILAIALIGVILARIGRPFDGARFGSALAFYAASRLLLEAFHGDSSLTAGVRSVQLVSLAVLMVALVLLRRWAIEANKSGTVQDSSILSDDLQLE
jgi:phosphatidylglycerol---prolipoprotein diacylglyceryl transferase